MLENGHNDNNKLLLARLQKYAEPVNENKRWTVTGAQVRLF
jgi:hypothetical protein